MEKRSTISRPKSSQTNPYTDFNSEVQPSRFHPGTRRTEIIQQAVMPAMMTQVRASVRKPAKPGIVHSPVWNVLGYATRSRGPTLRPATMRQPHAGDGHLIWGIQLGDQSEIRKENCPASGVSLSAWSFFLYGMKVVRVCNL